MFRPSRKPPPPLWQDALTAIGRAVLRALGLAFLGALLLALAYCTMQPKANHAKREAAEVARLANCQRYAMAQVRLGNHLLTVPANGATRLGLIADISPTYIFNETGLRAQPATPHFFCIPAELGQPPFAAMSVSFSTNRNSSATPARRDLRVVHAMQEQDNIGRMQLFSHRPDWDSMAGAKDLARPHPSQPAGQMTTALAIDRREPPFKASDRMIARTANPDADGFRYAADCIRPERVDFSSCVLLIEDANTGLTYRLMYVRISGNVFQWQTIEPVPAVFLEAARMMRRVLGDMKDASLRP